MLSYPMVSVDEVKEFLGITNTKLDVRLRLLIASATAIIESERGTGRFFTKQVATEYFSGRDNVTRGYDFVGGTDSTYGSSTSSAMMSTVATQTLYLRGVGVDPTVDPLIWYDPYANVSDTPYGADTALVPGRDFTVDYDNDNILLFIPTRYCPRALKVTYQAGYDYAATPLADPAADPPVEDGPITLSAALPDELKLAVMTQVQWMNVKLRSDNIGMGVERTTNKRDTVTATSFLATSGLTPEVGAMLSGYRRARTGRR